METSLRQKKTSWRQKKQVGDKKKDNLETKRKYKNQTYINPNLDRKKKPEQTKKLIWKEKKPEQGSLQLTVNKPEQGSLQLTVSNNNTTVLNPISDKLKPIPKPKPYPKPKLGPISVHQDGILRVETQADRIFSRIREHWIATKSKKAQGGLR